MCTCCGQPAGLFSHILFNNSLERAVPIAIIRRKFSVSKLKSSSRLSTNYRNTAFWLLEAGTRVLQGSVLGPILFLFYINDLPDNIQSNVRLFADDTAVYLAVQGQEDTDIIQNGLNILQEWEKAWYMEFNPSKCQVVHTSGSRKPIKTSTLCTDKSLIP